MSRVLRSTHAEAHARRPRMKAAASGFFSPSVPPCVTLGEEVLRAMRRVCVLSMEFAVQNSSASHFKGEFSILNGAPRAHITDG